MVSGYRYELIKKETPFSTEGLSVYYSETLKIKFVVSRSIALLGKEESLMYESTEVQLFSDTEYDECNIRLCVYKYTSYVHSYHRCCCFYLFPPFPNFSCVAVEEIN